MGNVTNTSQDEWSVFNNVAGLATLKEATTATSYEIRPALISANRFGALICSPFHVGVFGFGVFHFGDEIYSEQLLSLGYGNSIGNTSLGLRVSYIQYHAEGFGTHGILGFDFGGITKLTKQIFIGAWIQNLNQPKLNINNHEKAPVKLYASVGFTPTQKFILITEVEKDILYPAIWKSGLQYSVAKKFFIRVGFNINPNAFYSGVGFQTWRIKMDYSYQGFSLPGVSHQASASYRISKFKSKE
jgi:hypothetical protein